MSCTVILRKSFAPSSSWNVCFKSLSVRLTRGSRFVLFSLTTILEPFVDYLYRFAELSVDCANYISYYCNQHMLNNQLYVGQLYECQMKRSTIMKIIVLAKRREEVPNQEIQPHVRAEIQAVWDLYMQGTCREFYTRA